MNTGVYVLVPKRLQQFTDAWLSSSDSNSLLRQAWSLLHYCNIRCVPKELKIDCYKFHQTFFWQDYILRNPLAFIQEFLSGVEVLEFCSDSNILSCGRYYGAGSITFLRCIISSNQPRLKHLKISGSPEFAKNVLESIADVSSTKPIYYPWSELYTAPLPYHLESLSVLMVKSAVSCIDLSYTERIVSILRSISTFQINLLCMVTLQDIDSCSNDVGVNRIDHSEYNAPLSVLNQFLKQPQFRALAVFRTSYRVACELIVTFLTTATMHEQSLSIGGRNKEEEKLDKLSNDRCKLTLTAYACMFPSQQLSETNGQYKCLDLQLSYCDIHSWLLFSLPELKLKKLTIATQYMALAPGDMVIEVEHVTLVGEGGNLNKIFSAHLEKFVLSNLALKRLEFANMQLRTLELALLPALTCCLSALYQLQGRALEQIVMTLVQFEFEDVEYFEEFCTRVRHLLQSYGTGLTMTTDFDRYVVEF